MLVSSPTDSADLISHMLFASIEMGADPQRAIPLYVFGAFIVGAMNANEVREFYGPDGPATELQRASFAELQNAWQSIVAGI